MQPENRNLLSSLKFTFTIQKLPYVEYFGQSINIPGLTVPQVDMRTALNPIQFRSDRVEYEDLKIGFVVDEDLYSWQSIFNWMIGMGFPDNYEQYYNLLHDTTNPNPGNKSYSDITLMIRNSNNNPIMEVNFNHCWPTHLTGLDFSATSSDSPNFSAVASFKFLNITIKRV